MATKTFILGGACDAKLAPLGAKQACGFANKGVKMASHYLIDYENVREAGVNYCHHAEEGDIVYLIYTSNASKIGLDALAGMKASVRVIKVAAGKQSLDMHLISILGFLVHKHGSEDRYLVISKDTGYDSVLRYWTAQGYKALRISGSEGSQKAAGRPGVSAPVQKGSISGQKTPVNNESVHGETTQNVAVQREPIQHVTDQDITVQNVDPDTSDSGIQDGISAAQDTGMLTQDTASKPENTDMSGEAAASANPAGNGSRNSRSRRSRRSRSSARKQAAAQQTVDVHEEDAAGTSAETSKPEAAAPEASAAKTSKPEAAAPETSATKTSKPEAAAPETELSENAMTENTSAEAVTFEPAASEAAEHEVSMIEAETPEPKEAKEPKETAGEQRKRLNGRILSILSKEKVDIKTAGQIASVAVKNAGTKDAKRTIYRTLLQKFGQKQGLSYYTLIKKEL